MGQVGKFQAVKQFAIDSGLLDSQTEHSVVGTVGSERDLIRFTFALQLPSTV